MELSISDAKTKQLMTEVMVDLLKNKRGKLVDIVLEALEEVALANAINEGRQNDLISKAEIFAILDDSN
ncbi:MAG: hypothetical protein WAX77_10450 [Methylococcaceae bacterium]